MINKMVKILKNILGFLKKIKEENKEIIFIERGGWK